MKFAFLKPYFYDKLQKALVSNIRLHFYPKKYQMSVKLVNQIKKRQNTTLDCIYLNLYFLSQLWQPKQRYSSLKFMCFHSFTRWFFLLFFQLTYRIL